MKFLRTFENLKQIILDTGCVVDNQFLDLYIELIIKNLTTSNISHVTQRHHFIPASAYEFSDGESARSLANRDSKNFKVNLKFYDHIKAHYLLIQCGKSLSFISANASAVSFMYNNLKIAQREGIVSQLETAEEIAKAYKYVKDKQAEEAIKSEKKPFDLVAWNQNRLTGKVAVCNGDTYLYVTPEEATNLILNEGWKPGIKGNGSYYTVSKGEESGIVKKSELTTYLKNGWTYQAGGVIAGATRLHVFDSEPQEQVITLEQVSKHQKKVVRCCETGEIFPTVKALAEAYNLKAQYSALTESLRAKGDRRILKQQKLFGKTFEYCWVEA